MGYIPEFREHCKVARSAQGAKHGSRGMRRRVAVGADFPPCLRPSPGLRGSSQANRREPGRQGIPGYGKTVFY